jgi:hypothetical protein
MRCAPCLATFLLVISSYGVAQDRALISGDAEDRQDAPVTGVTVTLRNDSLRIERKTTTNSDGLYFFAEVVPAEGYVIEVAAPGMAFAPEKVKFDIEVGETRHVLPSFIGEKSPAPVSGLQRRRQSDWESQVASDVSKETFAGPIAALAPVALVTPETSSWLIAVNGARGDSEEDTDEGGQAPATSSQPRQQTAPPAKPTGKSKGSTVESARVPLDTLSTALSTVITSNQLRSLPLYNRNFLALGLLVSSTHDVPAWSELKDTTFSISGQRPTSNAFLLDGMDNEATSSNQAIPFQVNDAVQEFRVVTANSDAQFGRNIGGVVNIVTQRGTARFHGSVFGFFADNAIDATSPLSVYGGSGFEQAAAFAGPVNAPPLQSSTNPPFAPIFEPSTYNEYVATVKAVSPLSCTVPNPTSAVCNPAFDPQGILAQHNSHTQPFSSQQFGGQAGGSFLKRWFWFGDYEGTRINNPNPIFERVPSSYDRTLPSQFPLGSSGYPDAAFAQAVLALYPKANVIAVPDVLEFYQGQAPNYTNVNNYMGRVDFNQSARTDWTFRYNVQSLSQLHDDTLPSSSVYPGNGVVRSVLNQNGVLTFTHSFSDHLSNVVRGGWSRFQVEETPQDASFNTSAVGLPPGQIRTYLLSGLDPRYAGATPTVNGAWGGWFDSIWAPSAVPVIAPSLDGLFPFARIGAPLSAPAKRQDTELQFIDNLVWFKGRHTVRTGVDLRHLENIFDNGGFSRGMVVSSDIGEFTSDSETCIQCGEAFSNPGFDYAMKQPSPYDTTFHSYVIAGYLQDTWRARSNLTINLGLRYEYFSPPSELNHQLWNYDPQANGLVRQDETAVTDPFGRPCGGIGNLTNRSIYPDQRSMILLPWTCNPNGNGSFVVANTTNFEPRLGVAWSTPDGKTVIRAAFGIFYDEVPVSLTAQLAFNRPITAPVSALPQTIYGQNFQSGHCQQCAFGNTSFFNVNSFANFYQSASVPFSISAVDPSGLNNPFTRQVNFTIGRQLSQNASAELAYVGNFMGNLSATNNTGFNNEWFCTKSAQGNMTQPCDPFSNLPIFTRANVGYGNYNALVARFFMKSWHGLQIRASYTYSKALDTGSSAAAPLIPGPMMAQLFDLGYFGTGNPLLYALGNTSSIYAPPPVFNPSSISASFSALTSLLTAGVRTTGAGTVQVTPYLIPQNPNNFLRNDYGPSDYNQTNRFILEYTWQSPSSLHSVWLKDWLLSGIFIAENGQPFTVFSGPIAGELTQRVNLSGPLSMTGNPNSYIGNLQAISLPGAACVSQSQAFSPYVLQSTVGIKSGEAGIPCIGNSGRNQFTGPGYVDYDMALQRLFKIHERLSLSLRAESYNLFNHPNFYNPISTYSLDGVTQYSQFGQIKSAHNSRQFQFGVRLNW